MVLEEKEICEICHSNDLSNIVDLGFSPIANKFCAQENMEIQAFPLVLDFCAECFNLQLRHCFDASYLYDETYSYATPVAASLDSHYESTLEKLAKLGAISNESCVVEIGSNNGNFLQVVQKVAGKVLGIDPASNVTAIANCRGIPTVTGFFNEDTASSISADFGKVDLLVARHMFAHNTMPAEMIKGVRNCLAPGGTFLVENAYAVETLLHGEFDQVYHEHMFYYSASSMSRLMKNHGFDLYDIYFSNVHGGSASFFICKEGERAISAEVIKCLDKERDLFTNKDTFLKFKSGVCELRAHVNSFVEQCDKNGESIAIYSVPNKLFTFLSFTEFPLNKIEFMVDTSLEKIGKFYPNSNIKIFSESELQDRQCDVFLIGAWNYKREIVNKSPKLFKPGTKLVFALPFFDVIVV
tara:strand:- start:347 stop:1582 length:1236 start_codon:yes stop_codon:yes gene_type:complete